MTLIDSSDSILMLYSYSGFPERSFFIFSKSPPERDSQEETIEGHTTTGNDSDTHTGPVPISEIVTDDKSGNAQNDLQDRKDDEKNGLHQEPMDPAQSMTPRPQGHASDSELERDIRVKMNMMSGLSIILTLMSILVAFRYDYLIVQYNHNAKRPGSYSISIITIMGLIGQECASCVKAAEADDGHGGGLAGSWWRGWAAVSLSFFFSSCQTTLFSITHRFIYLGK